MDEQLFHDHSTTIGQIKMRINRLKGFCKSNWLIIAPIVTLALVAGYFVVDRVSPNTIAVIDKYVLPSVPLNHSSNHEITTTNYDFEDAGDDNNATSNSTVKHHLLRGSGKHDHYSEKSHEEIHLVIEGNDTAKEFEEFSDIDNPVNVSSITLRHVELDGPKFSKSLAVFRNLETLVLDNVTIHKLLETKRVTLPKLKYFSAKLTKATVEHNDSHDKPKEILKSILLFEKEKGKGKHENKHGWDFEKDLANLDVDIRVNIGGSKLLTVNRTGHELLLNFKACEEILKNANWSPEILTIASCSISEATLSKKKALHYLNIDKVPLTDEELAKILKKQTHLTELLVNIPNGTINLDDVPKTVNFLSVSGMKIKSKDGKRALSSIRELSITDGVLEEKVVTNFKTLLSKVETVAIFNKKHPHPGALQKLLAHILKTKASRIIIGNLTMTSENQDEHIENGILTVEGDQETEGYLKGIGIPKHSKHNFMIMLPHKGDDRVGIPLSVHETRYFHFTLSEKNKVLTFKEYLKVEAEPKKEKE
jgi:hypothetical protein